MYKFSNVFEFHKKSKIKAGDGKPEGKYPFYTSSTELNKYVDDYLFDGESLVFGTGGNASVHFAQNKFAVSTDCLVAQMNTKDVNPKFVYYYLSGNIHILEQGFKGAGLKHISKAYISEITFPKFSRKKQDKIVQILDTADNLHQKRKEQLALLDDYLKSVFHEMFGDPIMNQKKWEIYKLGEFTSYVGSGATPLGGSKVYQDSGIIFIRSQNVLMNELNFSNVAHISSQIHKAIKRTFVKKNDVLLNITGASIGRAAIFNGEDNSANVNQHVCIIRLNDYRLNPKFLSRFIAQPSYQMKILSSNSGATRQAFNFSQIKKFNIFLPPMYLQNKFASIVEQVEKTKQKMRDSLNEMDNHFNALMQRYFE